MTSEQEAKMREAFEKYASHEYRNVSKYTATMYKRGLKDFAAGAQWQAALASLPRLTEEELHEEAHDAFWSAVNDMNAEVDYDYSLREAVRALIARFPHLVKPLTEKGV